MVKLILTDNGYLDEDGKDVDIELYKGWYSIPYESSIYIFQKEDDYNTYLLLVKKGTQKVFETIFIELSNVK